MARQTTTLMLFVWLTSFSFAYAGTWDILTYDGARRTTAPYLSSLAGGEQGTGAVRSPAFTIQKGAAEYRFLVNGWDGQGKKLGKNYFQLCDAATGKELRRAAPPDKDFFTPVVWNVRDLTGHEVYFRAVDGMAESAFAWIGCKDVPIADGKITKFRRRESPEGWCEEFEGEPIPIGRPIIRDPQKQIELDWAAQDIRLGIRWSRWSGQTAQGQRDLLVRIFSEMFDRAGRMMADFQEMGVDPAALEERRAAIEGVRARFASLVKRTSVEPADVLDWRALYMDARKVMRELAFVNPLLKFGALLFVKRYTQQSYSDINVNHHAWGSAPGGDICVLSPIRPGGKARQLLDGKLGPGNVHGIDLSWDGQRVLFAYARSETDEPPKGWQRRQSTLQLHRTVDLYHLYEINVDGAGLRQLTHGRWSDLNPCYLPNGDIAFESERCGIELNCNEMDKDEPTTNLYVMRSDGTGIRRLAVTKDGDWYPRVLNDGSIIYSHWEYHERDWVYTHPLWIVQPDGRGSDAFFKQHFNIPATLTVPRAIPDSRKVMAIAAGHHTLAAGPVVLVDREVGVNNPQGILRLTGPSKWPEFGGKAPEPSVPGWRVAPGEGWYMDPWPLSEKYFLASHCDGAMQDETGYALYLLDVYGGKELVYRDPTISSVMPIPLLPRPRPPVAADVRLGAQDDAVCLLTNVNTGVKGVPSGTIKYIRISEPVPWPFSNEAGGGRYEPDAKATGSSWTPIRVLGTVPVESDGSAYFRVPADAALYFQALDKDFMEVRRMRSYVSFQPGEVRSCAGCHETRSEAPQQPRAFPLALKRDPSVPVPPHWGPRPINFLRDIQPVLDRHCTLCHSGLKPAKGIDLSGGLTERHNRAYNTLIPGPGRPNPTLISIANKHDDTRISQPNAFGSRKSKLVEILRSTHKQIVHLTKDDWKRLVTWIDANAVYHDRTINKRPLEGEPYNLATDGDLFRRISLIHASRCVDCHGAVNLARPEWIDLWQPEKSLFLTAPLAKGKGGTGKCSPAVYKSTSDPDYRSVLAIVRGAVRRAWERPRRDLKVLSQSERPW